MTDATVDLVFEKICEASKEWHDALDRNIHYRGDDPEEEKRLYQESEEAWNRYIGIRELAKTIGVIG